MTKTEIPETRVNGAFDASVAAQQHRANLPPDEPSFQRAYYEDFVALLGLEQAATWLERLAGLLEPSFARGGETPAELARKAHALIGLAGIPGFRELSRVCSALERALSTQSAYQDEVSAVSREAEKVAGLVSFLRTDLAVQARG